jgi:hypothetical protein
LPICATGSTRLTPIADRPSTVSPQHKSGSPHC